MYEQISYAPVTKYRKLEDKGIVDLTYSNDERNDDSKIRTETFIVSAKDANEANKKADEAFKKQANVPYNEYYIWEITEDDCLEE
ncbi:MULTISPECIES: hypothetical protein [Bacillus]|uniref:Uncharacterized protein n=1 Tax=Bacillus glycinifermentans TaxID=1664069 RepID=A0A0T6BIJ5_9BACI|nr:MULTISPECIES: hypothetical protein [Bacillus]KRT87138.1 hypothetical protein AB447_209230 [Bacillus glycinifermentans]MEC0487190.1 hypothetical protein [Bacillus glycinifermentans]UBF35303.1 hypothetical protein K9N56_24270 [Bacillus sp. PM8313]